jgi:hypothetical protein
MVHILHKEALPGLHDNIFLTISSSRNCEEYAPDSVVYFVVSRFAEVRMPLETFIEGIDNSQGGIA